MNVISIDPGKACSGIYAIIDNQDYCFTIENSYKDPMEKALLNIYETIKHFMINKRIHLGLIEGYGFNPQNKSSMVPMSEVGGVYKLAFAKANLPIITIPIQTWKLLTIGQINKNKHKEEYLSTIDFKYNKQFNSVDIADAFLIYQAARELSKKTKRLTPSMVKIRSQIETVINSIKKGN